MKFKHLDIVIIKEKYVYVDKEKNVLLLAFLHGAVNWPSRSKIVFISIT